MIIFARKLLILLTISTILPTSQILAKEELTIIQTVSKNRRSFVIAKGIKDGVLKGQEFIFANDSVSVVCRASEVSRDFSLWIPIDKNITLPFNKDDVVSTNSNVYGNVALEVAGDTSLTPEDINDDIYKKFRKSNNYDIKLGINRGLTQSSSSVSNEKNPTRNGYHLSLDYNYRFLPEFEMSLGFRIDNEVYRIEQPELDVPTKRTFVTIGATYHLVNFTNTKNNIYLSLAAGIGKSTTTVNSENSSGMVTLIPEARLGYLIPLSKSMAIVFEGSIESLSSKETFNDGTEQTTNLLNFRGTAGLRF